MSVQPYPDDQAERFAELADLFLRCRAAWREVTVGTQGHATSGSQAARDRQEIAERIAPGHPHAGLVIQAAVQRYMLAASEQCGGLAALYGAQEVLFSPSAVARSVIEACASAAWVLGTNGEATENRLARAYREELKSAEEAKKNAGRLLGKEHPEYLWVSDRHTERPNGGKPLERPTYKEGEHLVIYLTRGPRRGCPAIVRVVAPPEYDPDLVAEQDSPESAERWGWVTWVDVLSAVDLSDAPQLGDLGIAPRSVGQHGHIHIGREQYRRAWEAIPRIA